jgi:hypothetical protein
VSSNGSLEISRRAVGWFYKLQGKTDGVGMVISKINIFSVQEGEQGGKTNPSCRPSLLF